MEEIKEAVGAALERKGVLSRLRAELRANVFFAIDEQEQNNGGAGLSQKTSTPQRESLLASSDGLLLFGLVHEFLKCCSLDFTVQVYEPEVGVPTAFQGRSSLGQQLGLGDAAGDTPLLLALLRKARNTSAGSTGGAARSSNGGSSAAAAAAAPAAAAPPPAPLSASRRAPLAPVGRLTPPLEHASQPLSSPPAQSHPEPSSPPPPPPAAPAAAAKASLPAPLAPRPVSALPAMGPALAPAKAPPPPAAPLPRMGPPPPPLPPPPPPAPPAAAAAEPSGEVSYGDDPEFEVDEEELGSQGGLDDDEDYNAVFGGGSQPSDPPTIPPNLPAAAPVTAAPRASELPSGREDDLSDSNLSTSGIAAGRMRRAKPTPLPVMAARDVHDREDTNFHGDRSFGVSTELGGYSAAPPSYPSHLAPLGASGGLSFSGEIPRSPQGDETPTGHSGRLGSLPLGKAPFAPLGKLEPFGAPKSLGQAKLGALGGPLGALKPPLAPLSSSKEDAMAHARMRKSSEDVKEELRRSGLISTDSINGGNASASQSMELPDFPQSTSGPQHAPGAAPRSGHSATSSGRPAASIYDGEMSVSNSMDIVNESQVSPPLVSHHSASRVLSSLPSRKGEGSGGGAGLADEDSVLGRNSSGGGGLGLGQGLASTHSLGAKGFISMDFRDTGLSADDNSGELDKLMLAADMAESAEWEN